MGVKQPLGPRSCAGWVTCVICLPSASPSRWRLWSSSLGQGRKVKEGKPKARSPAAGKGSARLRNPHLPMNTCPRAPEGFHLGPLRSERKRRLSGSCFKMQVLLLFREEEANRAGGDGHWEDNL